MDTYLIWLIAGFLLVIVELVSGTFYLVVLGVAAAAGGVVAYTGLPFSVQAIVAATMAVVGVVLGEPGAQAFHRREDALAGHRPAGDVRPLGGPRRGAGACQAPRRALGRHRRR